MSINDADEKFLSYLSDEQNVKDYFNSQIQELIGRIKEADDLAGTYQANNNKEMFQATLHAKHGMLSEFALAQMSKISFIANARHQQQIKYSLQAIISDNKNEITVILSRITDIEQQARDLRTDSDFLNHLRRRYEDKAGDISLE